MINCFDHTKLHRKNKIKRVQTRQNEGRMRLILPEGIDEVTMGKLYP